MNKFKNPKHFFSHTNEPCGNLSFYLLIHLSLSKSLKFLHILVLKSALNLPIKLNSLLLKILFLSEKQWEIYFIPRSFSNLGYIGKTRIWLRSKINDCHRHVRNKEFYKSSFVSHCWSYNFDFASFHILCPSHLDFHEAFYNFKIKKNC